MNDPELPYLLISQGRAGCAVLLVENEGPAAELFCGGRWEAKRRAKALAAEFSVAVWNRKAFGNLVLVSAAPAIELTSGRKVWLKTPIEGLECWNLTDGSTHTLPAGRWLEVQGQSTGGTTCQLLDPADRADRCRLVVGEHAGAPTYGYRFIIPLSKLAAATGHRIPAVKAFDTVGFIMALESGEASQEYVEANAQAFVDSGVWRHLQGSWQRTVHQWAEAGLVNL